MRELRHKSLLELGLALVTAGVVVLLFVVYELVGTNLSEEHSQAQLAREFNTVVSDVPSVAPAANGPQPSGPRAPSRSPAPAKEHPVKARRAKQRPAIRYTPGPKLDGTPLPLPPPGGALDHIVIPAIGVDRYVVQGVAENDLQMGPGHYPGTALPGQPGNVGIAGHRTTFGAPFFRLNELTHGDLVYLTDTTGTTWVYSVQRQWVVPPTDVGVLDPSHRAELTLTTCNPRFEATNRLVVRAMLVERLTKGTRLAGHLPATTSSTGHKTTVVAAGPHARTATAPKAHDTPGTKSNKAKVVTATTVAPPPTTAPRPARASPSGASSGDSPTVGPGPAAVATGQGSIWAGALGWGALALAGWVATRLLAARRYRYAKVGALVAGALACLVPLWFAFENVVDLLPANL